MLGMGFGTSAEKDTYSGTVLFMPGHSEMDLPSLGDHQHFAQSHFRSGPVPQQNQKHAYSNVCDNNVCGVVSCDGTDLLQQPSAESSQALSSHGNDSEQQEIHASFLDSLSSQSKRSPNMHFTTILKCYDRHQSATLAGEALLRCAALLNIDADTLFDSVSDVQHAEIAAYICDRLE